MKLMALELDEKDKMDGDSPETLKYLVGVLQGQSYLMVKRSLFSLG